MDGAVVTTGAEAATYLADKYNPPADFVLASKSRRGRSYPMVVTPDGYAVHSGEGCEGELFNGPLGCWHSKEHTMTTSQALVRAEAILSPAPIEFNDAQVAVIKESIAQGATDAELALFITTCTRTGLDPFMRQIYAVKRWDARAGKEVMGIQVGIDGMRLIAERTGKYGGQDPIQYMDAAGNWSEVWLGEGNPVAAKATVYRKDWTRPAVAIVRWDSYAQTYKKNNQTYLMPTWAAMPDVMLGKCAESLAMRRAFPAEMSAMAAALGEGTYDPTWDVAPIRTDDDADPRIIEGEVIEPEAPRQAAAPATAGPSESPVSAPAAASPEPAPAPTPAPQAAQPAPEPPATKAEPKAPAAGEAAAISSFWAATRMAKLKPDDVTARCKTKYDGREPMHLTPAERTAFLTELTTPQPEPVPAAVYETPEEHKKSAGHDNQTFDNWGNLQCADCNAPLMEPVAA